MAPGVGACAAAEQSRAAYTPTPLVTASLCALPLDGNFPHSSFALATREARRWVDDGRSATTGQGQAAMLAERNYRRDNVLQLPLAVSRGDKIHQFYIKVPGTYTIYNLCNASTSVSIIELVNKLLIEKRPR